MVITDIVIGRLVAGLAGVGLLALGYRIWSRRDRSTAETFAAVLGVVGVAALCSALLSHRTIAYKLIWLYAFVGIPVVFARFSFDYYGIKSDGPRFVWTAVPPVLAAVAGTFLLLVNPEISPAINGSSALLGSVFEVALALRDIGMYYSSGLMLVALGLVIRIVLRYEHLPVGLGVALAFVGGWSWVAYVISPELVALVGPGGSLLVIAGCYVTSLAAGLLTYRHYDLFETAPAAGNVAPEHVLDAIEDAVVVITEDHRVLRLNAAAAEQFGVSEPGAIGGDLEEIVGIEPVQLTSDSPVDLVTTNGTRRFELETSAISDRSGNIEGQAIVCRDITRQETREQRLQVLNRVMRHNLRNELSKILGHADLIADGGQDATAARASTIKGTAEDLVSLGERAREVEQLMAVSGQVEEPADIGEAIDMVAAESEDEYPALELSTAVGSGLESPVNDRILRIVLRNLIDNACTHNDADEPLVVVSAETDDSGNIAIAVADNGPGIAEQELQPLQAGGEEALKHGSGLGLWTAYWGVTRMGGSLSFSDNEPRGTVVRVDVPGAGTTG